jgi:biotin carboxylase
VLLVEEGWHSTMYLASGLERAGFGVTVLTANGSTARCRHRTTEWISGPPVASAAFVPCLRGLGSFDHILPLTESVMARLWDAGIATFPITEPWQRRLLRNKHALIEHMACRGIAVPRQRRVVDDLDLDALGLGDALAIKGSTGSAGRMVRLVKTRGALEAAVARARQLGGEWVVQEAIASPTYLFGGLFDRGRALRIYAAEKLEQHPPQTGGAIRLRSIHEAALVDAGTRVMRELAWTGFASADFVRRADGTFLLLEVNPRLWGSLAGAMSAGVDLFAPFAALLGGEHPAPELAFEANDDCWIFPRYLNAARHRTWAGASRALRDLRGEQGRDWRDPRFVLHVIRRLRRMKRLAAPQF